MKAGYLDPVARWEADRAAVRGAEDRLPAAEDRAVAGLREA